MVWLFPAAALLYVVSSLRWSAQTAWTVLVSDQWGLYTRYLTEEFPGSVLGLHNGHSLAVPGLVYLLDIRLTGAQNWLAISIGLSLIAATAAIVSTLSLRERTVPRDHRVVFASLPWMLLFWQGNARVLGDIAGVPVGLVLASVAVAAIGLAEFEKGGKGRSRLFRVALLALSLGAALVATFSYGFGVSLWPAILIVGLVLKVPRAFGLITGAGLMLAVAAYLFLLPDADRARAVLSFEQPLRVIEAGLTWLGAPAFHVLRGAVPDAVAVAAAVVLGAAGVAAAALGIAGLFRRHRSGAPVGRLEIWCAVAMIFGLSSAFQVALARAGKLEANPLAMLGPRYLAWVMHFWIATLIFAGIRSLKHRSVGRANLEWWVAIASLPLVLLPVHHHYATAHGHSKWRAQEAALSLLVGVRDDVAVRRALNPFPNKAHRLASILREQRFNMFGWDAARWLGRPLLAVADIEDLPAAPAVIDVVEALAEADGSGGRFAGRLFDSGRRHQPAYIVAVDCHGVVRGLGLLAERRTTGTLTLPSSPMSHLAFRGYLDAGYRSGNQYRFYAIFEEGNRPRARSLEWLVWQGC